LAVAGSSVDRRTNSQLGQEHLIKRGVQPVELP
jgi:hypothetical protein